MIADNSKPLHPVEPIGQLLFELFPTNSEVGPDGDYGTLGIGISRDEGLVVVDFARGDPHNSATVSFTHPALHAFMDMLFAAERYLGVDDE